MTDFIFIAQNFFGPFPTLAKIGRYIMYIHIIITGFILLVILQAGIKHIKQTHVFLQEF